MVWFRPFVVLGLMGYLGITAEPLWARRGLLLNSKLDKSRHKPARTVLKRSHRHAQAKVFYLQGQYERSLKIFQQFLMNHRKHCDLDEAYLYAGLCYDALGDGDNAVICWDRLIYQKSDALMKRRALMVKARFKDREGQTFEAMRLYELILQVAPLDEYPVASVHRLIELYRKYDRASEAGRLDKKARALMPISQGMAFFVKSAMSRRKYFSVQVGAFKTFKNANQLKRHLKKKGFDVFIVRDAVSKHSLYKVRVGQLKAHSQVRTLQRDMWSQEKLKGSVVFELIPL